MEKRNCWKSGRETMHAPACGSDVLAGELLLAAREGVCYQQDEVYTISMAGTIMKRGTIYLSHHFVEIVDTLLLN